MSCVLTGGPGIEKLGTVMGTQTVVPVLYSVVVPDWRKGERLPVIKLKVARNYMPVSKTTTVTPGVLDHHTTSVQLRVGLVFDQSRPPGLTSVTSRRY